MFKDSVIVITGGSSGLGKALAQKLVTKGANLALIARNEKKLRQVKEELSALGKAGQRIEVFSCDVSNYDCVEQTEAAIEAGARHATHFYDVFPVPEETDAGVRPVGAVEAILADSRVSVDFICDGVHVHPAAIRAAVAAKGWEKVMLITDSNIGAGLPPGEHDTPWGYRVRVAPGDAARHATKGFLAGSALTMDVGMKNLLRWLAPALTPAPRKAWDSIFSSMPGSCAK